MSETHKLKEIPYEVKTIGSAPITGRTDFQMIDLEGKPADPLTRLTFDFAFPGRFHQGEPEQCAVIVNGIVGEYEKNGVVDILEVKQGIHTTYTAIVRPEDRGGFYHTAIFVELPKGS